MWFSHQNRATKDGAIPEGKRIDVGNLNLVVKRLLAQGGFSFVYLAECVETSKEYALKHVIATDEDTLSTAKKEIDVMLCLKGHPNVVELFGHAYYDDGTKTDVFLAMEYCVQGLVDFTHSSGSNFFSEREIFFILIDICNGLHAMHSQTPPIAHRDIKAENVLLGLDGTWKLCDFGSTSKNHKIFSSLDEMAVEEGLIRRNTTPAYRAPEMWDLYSRRRISEKVDIWALGCLLYRMAFFRSCFDGEFSLQILNCNFKFPEKHNYSKKLLDLIRVMLIVEPEKRPNIKQVWQIANATLPPKYQKKSPTPWFAPAWADLSFPESSTSTESPANPVPDFFSAHNNPPKTSGSFWNTQVASQVASIETGDSTASDLNLKPRKASNDSTLSPPPFEDLESTSPRKLSSVLFGSDTFSAV